MEVRHVIIIIVIIVLLLVIWYNREKWKNKFKGGSAIHNTWLEHTTKPRTTNRASVSMYVGCYKNNTEYRYFVKIGSLSLDDKKYEFGEFKTHTKSKNYNYLLVWKQIMKKIDGSIIYQTTDNYLNKDDQLITTEKFTDYNTLTTLGGSKYNVELKQRCNIDTLSPNVVTNVYYHITMSLSIIENNGSNNLPNDPLNDAARIISSVEAYLHSIACYIAEYNGFGNCGDTKLMSSDPLQIELNKNNNCFDALRYKKSFYNNENYLFINDPNNSKYVIQFFRTMEPFFIEVYNILSGQEIVAPGAGLQTVLNLFGNVGSNFANYNNLDLLQKAMIQYQLAKWNLSQNLSQYNESQARVAALEAIKLVATREQDRFNILNTNLNNTRTNMLTLQQNATLMQNELKTFRTQLESNLITQDRYNDLTQKKNEEIVIKNQEFLTLQLTEILILKQLKILTILLNQAMEAIQESQTANALQAIKIAEKVLKLNVNNIFNDYTYYTTSPDTSLNEDAAVNFINNYIYRKGLDFKTEINLNVQIF